MPAEIPTELLLAVFAHLSPAALASVVLACSRYNTVASALLYAHVSVADSLTAAQPEPRRTVCACETLSARPDLAQHTRQLTVRWQAASGPRDPYLPAVLAALPTINAALRAVPDLEHLDLALGLAGAPIAPFDVLGGCAFPALKAFAFSGVGRGSLPAKFHPAPSPPLAWFLRETPSIQHLRLADLHEDVPLAPADLPLLCMFRGPAPAAASVLPGRRVHTLALVGSEHVQSAHIAAIAQSAAPITTLDLSGMNVTPIVLRELSRHLAAVRVLRVRLALRHTLHYSMSGISILAGLTPVLGAFRDLHQLDLSPTSIIDRVASPAASSGNALEEASLCATWARSCHSLRQITFPSSTEWNLTPEHMWAPRGGQSKTQYTRGVGLYSR